MPKDVYVPVAADSMRAILAAARMAATMLFDGTAGCVHLSRELMSCDQATAKTLAGVLIRSEAYMPPIGHDYPLESGAIDVSLMKPCVTDILDTRQENVSKNNIKPAVMYETNGRTGCSVLLVQKTGDGAIRPLPSLSEFEYPGNTPEAAQRNLCDMLDDYIQALLDFRHEIALTPRLQAETITIAPGPTGQEG